MDASCMDHGGVSMVCSGCANGVLRTVIVRSELHGTLMAREWHTDSKTIARQWDNQNMRIAREWDDHCMQPLPKCALSMLTLAWCVG